MADFPQAPSYHPDPALLKLGEPFYNPVHAADFPQTILRFRNDRAAVEVGLDGLSDEAWARHFGRFEPLPGNLPQPLAMRYHGHQFRVYNPELGDGRGFSFAQMRRADGALLELATKGSGQTPWSRFGDGRLTLKGGVREVLASEMLEALGVATSRSFSLIETGEALERNDEPSPTRSAVLVRMSLGHIRIGTFQRLAYHGDTDALERLVDYCLREMYGVEPEADPVAQFFDLVVGRTATLAAQYMAAGFVHGVLNTDNINVMGESFDYGPWRFAPTWEPGFTAAYFDHAGLYALARQPEAIMWNVAQLAVSLRRISEAPPLIERLETFEDRFRRACGAPLERRLGLQGGDPERGWRLRTAIDEALVATQAPIDRFFHDARGAALPNDYGQEWDAVRAVLGEYTPRPDARAHPHFAQGEPCSMLIDEVEAIWSAIDRDDDWGPFNAKVASIRQCGQALDARGAGNA
ncbi:protein adenylyltransferase SelO family protein [Sphingomonas turrisvirgatae]|uniref:Protein nucleotidyltransferase YdiU n=1 Tax=Sphingomonas turrisvirgatae TaxID=1888892 RepID=A0A1E3LVV5_9SPHN|nr:YdiU family protein [Sphingomonas turrisvirgatae]ODP37917.1 selenoprotein O [Sphingomonas turrisvirgatae]